MKKIKKKLIIPIVIALVTCISISLLTIKKIKKTPVEEMTEILNENSEDVINNKEQLKQFEGLLNSFFTERDKLIMTQDSEKLKEFYDLNKKVSMWAYESEMKKIKYLNNWAQKQGVNFNNINSQVKLRKVKEKSSGLYVVICNVSTEFSYYYLNKPLEENKFSLGTNHYLDLQKHGDNNYVVMKEWYTDPFADSLDLNNIKSDEMKEYILSREAPNYNMNEKVSKAVEYAHSYCGAHFETDFRYNTNYSNFNPEGGDCANFASQILHEGGGFKKNSTWNYYNGKGTKSWVNAQGFKNYMVGSGRASYIAQGNYQKIYKAAYNMRPGDFVAYEKKGRIVHVSTVTGLDSKGYPLVTCHNTDRLLVPYDLGWSNDNIKFHLIHVHY